MKAIEYNCQTGEITEREMTIEEIAQMESINEISFTNEDIRIKREQAYKERSDSLYIAYRKYAEMGEVEKSENAKSLWLQEIEKIDDEFPYNI